MLKICSEILKYEYIIRIKAIWNKAVLSPIQDYNLYYKTYNIQTILTMYNKNYKAV